MTAACARHDGLGPGPTYAASNPNAIGCHVGSRAGAAVRGCEGKFRGSRMRRTTAESVIVESTRILRSHLGQRSASKLDFT